MVTSNNEDFNLGVWLTSGIAALLGSFAAAAGIGGGGIYVPVYILVARITPQLAIPRSSCTMLGLGIVNFLFNANKRHPKADRPRIEFDVLLSLQPTLMLGAIIGVMLNRLFPAWLLMALLILLLGYSGVRAFINTYKLFKREQQEAREKHARDAALGDEHAQQKEGLLSSRRYAISINQSQPGSELSGALSDRDLLTPKENPELAKILKDESRMIPWFKVFACAFFEVGIATYTLLKGPAGKPSIVGIEPCSWEYWTITAATAPYFLFLTVCSAIYLNWQHRRKERLGYNYLPGDIQWNFKKCMLYPMIGLLAGTCAGLLGISSGMIVGPLLLEMAMLPPVITATTAFMIIFAQFAVALQYILFNQIGWQLGLYFIGTGAAASVLGQIVLYVKNKISQRDSLLAALMSTVVLVSCVLLAAVGIYDQVAQHLPYGFHDLCVAYKSPK